MKRTLFMIMLAIPMITASAQRETGPFKFDEFITNQTPRYFFDVEVTFETRLNRFIQRLKREPVGRVYLVYYRARVSQWNPYAASERRAEQAKQEITYKTRFYADHVDVIDGGVKDENTLEFWIGGTNSSPPKLEPKYAAADAVVCPEISIYAQNNHLDDREPATFAVRLNPDSDIGFKWRVSAGKILEGQGTSSIQVDVNGVKKIVVSLVGTLIPDACSKEKSGVFDIGMRPVLIDEFERIPESDLRARLDSFLTELSNNPASTGYLVIYGTRSLPRSLDSGLRLVRNHFAFRNFPLDRVKIEKGGYRDFGGMEIWMLAPGVNPPEPRPSVDTKFVQPPSRKQNGK